MPQNIPSESQQQSRPDGGKNYSWVDLFFAKRMWHPLGLGLISFFVCAIVRANLVEWRNDSIWIDGLRILIATGTFIALAYWVYSKGWNASIKAIKPKPYWDNMSEEEKVQIGIWQNDKRQRRKAYWRSWIRWK
jgi:hypothetical protein